MHLNTRNLLMIIAWICISSQALAALPNHPFRCPTIEINLPADLEVRSGRASSPMPEYNVGDSRNFWVWDLSVMPPVNVELAATCRAKGDHSYLWVEDAEWESNVIQSQIDSVLQAWELQTPEGSIDSTKGIYDITTSAFGIPPDALDNDPRIHLLFHDIKSFMGSAFDGYFRAYDEISDAEAQAQGERSNECEILYLDCNPSDIDSAYMLGVATHEFQHMIHFGSDPNEDIWVNEGCSQLAWFISGFGTDGQEETFAGNPNDDLTDWGSAGEDYGQVTLFFLYLYEQFGGLKTIQSISLSSANGFNGIEAGCNEQGYYFDRKMAVSNWAVANFLDNTSLDHGQYGYASIDLPAFKIYKTINVYPTGETYAKRKNWAAYYARFTSGTAQLNLNFGMAGGDFQGFMVYSSDAVEKYVIPMDPVYHGIQMPGFGDAGAVIDFIAVNRESPVSPQDFEFCATDAVTEDVSPPYVVKSTPWGIGIVDAAAEIILRDDHGNADLQTIQVLLNELEYAPVIEPGINGKDVAVYINLLHLPAESLVHIQISASDSLGAAMTPFDQYFRVADRPPITLGVLLGMPAHQFTAGDPFSLTATLSNPGPAMPDVPLFILLEVAGSFFSAPDWSNVTESISWYTIDIPSGQMTQPVLPEFPWPSGAGSFSNAHFYGAMTDASISEVLGELDVWDFGWN